ncbi:hypothetical protein A2U01_0064760, partial [Trifolium medium]|nr:hypothetical protein [Trifolium medium]
SDVPCTRKSPLSLDYRLFEGEHTADIATPSVQQTSGSLTIKQMIAELEDVSADMGEKNAKIDRVIQALMMEENADVAEG